MREASREEEDSYNPSALTNNVETLGRIKERCMKERTKEERRIIKWTKHGQQSEIWRQIYIYI